MISSKTRTLLLKTAHRLEFFAKQLRGAADKAKPEKTLFLHHLEERGWRGIRPCFVLSTGRTGTTLLNNILQLSTRADPHHEPRPELYRASRRAYEEIGDHPELFGEVLKSAREEYLLQAVREERVYVETNNQVTFFAPVIPQIFPDAVFLHLVRHPGPFVRSGIRRRWYTGNHSHDIGRIVPLVGDDAAQWEQWSMIEKIGWLWNETNRFIETFRARVGADRFRMVKSEDLFTDPDVCRHICDFIGIGEIPLSAIKRELRRPANPQRKGSFPAYEDWTTEDQEKLRARVPLAQQYGYMP